MAANQETVYIKGDRDVEVTKTDVTLGDLVSLECSNKDVIPKLKTLKILKIPEKKHQRCVISILKIIACIHEKYPGIDVQNLGETDIIVTYENQQTKGIVMHVIKTAFVAVLTFVGAAFSIMAFNNDVSVTKLFSKIYTFMIGTKPRGFSILEVSYSIGITIGILMFFNHLGKKRFSVDPTPLEVQMRTYENDIQTTLVENASRRGKSWMLVRQILMAVIGLSAGVTVAGGLFAFIIELGLIADFADRTHTGDKILLYEDCTAMGGIIGNIIYFFKLSVPFGKILLPIFGIMVGIFVGCWAMALAEILNVFPIFIRRIKIVRYISILVMSMAFGRGLGALLYFMQGW